MTSKVLSNFIAFSLENTSEILIKARRGGWMMHKKNIVVLLTICLMAVFTTACAGSSDENDQDKVADKESNSNNESSEISDDNDENQNIEEHDNSDSSNNDQEVSEENTNQSENTRDDSDDHSENDILSKYSAEEIEYARVWLQLGVTQEIDELYVEHFSAGEPLNPNDETSIDYPEDVIHLSGSRLVEGSITYSGNGDGTIKLYRKIPHRWDGKNPAGEHAYKRIIEATEQIPIDTGDAKKVEALIKKLNIHS